MLASAGLIGAERWLVLRATDLEARAVLAVRTHQHGPTTRSRVGAWLAEQRPDQERRWRAEPMGWLGRQVEVRLEVGTEAYRWEVSGDAVEPGNEATRALAERITAWAKQR